MEDANRYTTPCRICGKGIPVYSFDNYEKICPECCKRMKILLYGKTGEKSGGKNDI